MSLALEARDITKVHGHVSALSGAFAEIDSFPAAIAALRTGRARTDGLITHRFKLDDYADALDALRSDRTVHKIIIECWQE